MREWKETWWVGSRRRERVKWRRLPLLSSDGLAVWWWHVHWEQSQNITSASPVNSALLLPCQACQRPVVHACARTHAHGSYSHSLTFWRCPTEPACHYWTVIGFRSGCSAHSPYGFPFNDILREIEFTFVKQRAWRSCCSIFCYIGMLNFIVLALIRGDTLFSHSVPAGIIRFLWVEHKIFVFWVYCKGFAFW